MPRLATRQALEEYYEQPDVFERLVHNHQTKIFSMTLDDDPTGYLQVIDVDAERLERAKSEPRPNRVSGHHRAVRRFGRRSD